MCGVVLFVFVCVRVRVCLRVCVRVCVRLNAWRLWLTCSASHLALANMREGCHPFIFYHMWA